VTKRSRFKERVEKRRLEAEERNKAFAARGKKGQLEKLIREGHGECREAKTLRSSLEPS